MRFGFRRRWLSGRAEFHPHQSVQAHLLMGKSVFGQRRLGLLAASSLPTSPVVIERCHRESDLRTVLPARQSALCVSLENLADLARAPSLFAHSVITSPFATPDKMGSSDAYPQSGLSGGPLSGIAAPWNRWSREFRS